MNRRNFFKDIAALPLALVVPIAPAKVTVYSGLDLAGIAGTGTARIWFDGRLVWLSDTDYANRKALLEFFRSVRGRGHQFRIKGYPA